MKRLTLLLSVLAITVCSYAQSPVEWSFTAKKVNDKVYEIHLTATVQPPWRIYSQTTPGGGPLPTEISFNKHPLLLPQGKVKETGTMKRKYEEVFGVQVYYYQDAVDFVQTVRLKGSAKTNISGTVEFMTCNDQQCLPPKKVPFTVSIP